MEQKEQQNDFLEFRSFSKIGNGRLRTDPQDSTKLGLYTVDPMNLGL